MSPWAFTLAWSLPLGLLWRLYASDLGHFSTLIFVFVAIPLADLCGGRFTRTLSASAPLMTYRFMTWMGAALQISLLVAALIYVQTHTLTELEMLDLCLSVGVCSGGTGITLAHELIHRVAPRERFERGLGYILLAGAGYAHWGVEHVYGHHRFVATARDPATARFGESLYRFLPRTLLGTLRSAWQIASERRARGATRTHVVALAIGCETLTVSLLVLSGFWRAALLFVGQAIVAMILLEIINYVEHYGLLRRELAPNQYERVNARHSWNASERVTNLLLFNLQRHSDHHAHASRRYQMLEHHDASPQLPFGYPTMVLMATVPPLFFAVMNPRVKT